MRDFRKHASWYLTGYPVGGEVRRRFATCRRYAELEDLIAALDPTTAHRRGRRTHSSRPHQRSDSRRAAAGYLDHLDDLTVPDDADVMALSGG